MFLAPFGRELVIAISDSLQVSVIIPTYNAFERLQATIRSVLAQTYAATEIIVVDDGSTDHTPELPGVFGDAVRYVRTANGGQQRARNHGVSLAAGNWIALLDHDDHWEPGYLAEVNALAQAHPVDMTMCNSRTWQETPTGSFWKDENRFTQFAPPGYWDRVGANPSDRWTVLEQHDLGSYLRYHPSQTSMVTLRRSLYVSLGGFDERMRGNGAENFEFEVRALRKACVGLIWAPLVRMVRHDANASLDSSRMALDVVACLELILRDHDLSSAERAVVEAELQVRLPAALHGAFTLRRNQDVRAIYQNHHGAWAWKARLKYAVANLPEGVARSVAKILRA